MKPIFYFFCLAMFLPFVCLARQNPSINYRDSLAHLLTLPASDSSKARIGFLLSEDWTYTDTLKGRQFLEQAAQFAGNNKYLKALYLLYTGKLSMATDAVTAERSFLKADSLLSAFTTKEAYLFRAKAWHEYGVLQQEKDDDKAKLAAFLDKSIPLAQLAGDSSYIGINYTDVGVIFMNAMDYARAEFYFDRAIQLLEKDPSPSFALSVVYLTAAQNYIYLNKAPEAKRILDQSKVLLNFFPRSDLFIDYYASAGSYFKYIKQYERSLNSLDSGIAVAKRMNKGYEEQRLLFLKYRTYTLQQDYKNAKQVLLYIINNPVILFHARNRVNIYYELAETSARLGEMKEAYQWQKECVMILDSMYENGIDKEIVAIEAKYRNAEKEKEIAVLKAKNEQTILSAKNGRLLNWLLASASLFLLIILAFGYFFYRNSKRSTVQKEKIQITQAMLQGQEDERKRVARDLHDGLGGMLAGVKINLSHFAQGKENSHDMGELHNIINQLDSSVRELRRIAHNMMPEMLLRLGLEASLRDLCESLMSQHLAVDFQCLGIKDTIAAPEQITIYRIVQELLTNTVKHANARNVLVQCSQNDNVFFITIEDDGIGFNVNQLKEQQGIGLSNIKSRVAYVNGKMEILSQANRQGTSINIELHVTT